MGKINKLLVRGCEGPYNINYEEFDSEFGKYDFVKMISDDSTSFGVKGDGSVWVAGDGTKGQFGNGNNIRYNYFTKLDHLNWNDIKCFKIRNGAVFMIKNDGTVWRTGYGYYGNLGVGTIYDNANSLYTFTKIEGIANAKEVSLGYNSTLILTEDGYIYTTGKNEYGQLGDGTTTDNANFFKLTNISNVKHISSGYAHHIALTYNNELYFTGYNSYGQAGNGTTTSVTGFTKVNIDDVRQAECTSYGVHVLKNDGTLWSAGYSPTLGANVTSSSKTFIKSTIDGYVNKIFPSIAPVLFVVKTDGSLWVTGEPGYQRYSVGLGMAGTKYIFYKCEYEGNSEVIDVCSTSDQTYLMFDSEFVQYTGNAEGKSPETDARTYSFSRFRDFYRHDGCDGVYNINGKKVVTYGDGSYETLKNACKIFGGESATFLVDSYGTLYACGVADRTGLMDLLECQTYDKVGYFTNTGLTNVTKVVSRSCTLALTSDGDVYAAGSDGFLDSLFGRSVSTLTSFTKIPNLSKVKDIQMGYYCAYFIMENGDLYVIGQNQNNQLPITGDATVLTKVMENTKSIFVNVGYFRAYVIDNNGDLYSWGINTTTDLLLQPNKLNKTVTTPTKVQGVSNAKQVATGVDNTWVLLENGDLYGLGENLYYQLGNYSTATISTLTHLHSNIEKVQAGYMCNVYLKKDGTVVVSGYSGNYAIGIKSSDDKNSGENEVGFNRAIDISMAGNRTFILTNMGKLYHCGEAYSGEFGDGYTDSGTHRIEKFSATPRIYSKTFNDGINKVIAGADNNYIIRKNGEIFSNGSNYRGNLGLGLTYDNLNYSTSFKPMKDLVPKIIDADAKGRTLYALTSEGFVYSVGSNEYRETGISDDTNSIGNYLYNITRIPAANIVKVAAGLRHAVFLKNDGTVWGVGNNANNELGLGTDVTKYGFLTKLNIEGAIGVFCTSYETFVLKEDKTLWGCGYNSNSLLGTTATKSPFVQVTTNVEEVFAGYDALVVIKTDGKLYCTGSNGYGKLGVSSDTANKFVDMGFVKNDVKKISIGFTHAAILKQNGKLYTAGCNTNGQLGTGKNSTANVTKFTLISNSSLNNVVDVDCGYDHTIFTLSDGSLYTCGNNYNYGGTSTYAGKAAGDGNGYTHSSILDFSENMNLDLPETIVDVYKHKNFVQINGNKIVFTNNGKFYKDVLGSLYNPDGYTTLPFDNIKEFALSSTHALVLTYNGDVYAIGSNGYGQLGYKPNVEPLTEFTKLSLEGIKSIACGKHYSMFITSDGLLKSVGLNAEYELGLGNTTEFNDGALQTIPNMSDCKQVICGEQLALVIKNDNSLWVQGTNNDGIFGLGASSANTFIKQFTKVQLDVKKVEYNGKYIRIDKLDGSVWVTGLNMESLKLGSNVDTTVFNKIKIPDIYFNEGNLVSLEIDEFNKALLMVTRVPSIKPTVNILNKSFAMVTLEVNDENDYIDEIKMYINDELISTTTEINETVVFEIPSNKLNIGLNNVYFKAHSLLGDTLYNKVLITKAEGTMKFKIGDCILVKGNKYEIIDTQSDGSKISLILDKPLQNKLEFGDILRKFVNNVDVYVQVNNSGIYKPATFKNIETIESGYRENYVLNSEDIIETASLKIGVTDGDEWTAIKRPVVIFKIDEESL